MSRELMERVRVLEVKVQLLEAALRKAEAAPPATVVARNLRKGGNVPPNSGQREEAVI